MCFYTDRGHKKLAEIAFARVVSALEESADHDTQCDPDKIRAHIVRRDRAPGYKPLQQLNAQPADTENHAGDNNSNAASK